MRALILISALILSACSAALQTMEFKDPTTSVVWPAPPEKPKIRYLARITGPQDVVAAPGKVERFFTLITGEKAEYFPFETPMGIATDGLRQVYVADGAAKVVHCLDMGRQEVDYITHAGQQRLRSPVAVAVAPGGAVYVSDSVLAKVFKYSPKREFLGELQGETLQRPAGLAITHEGEKIVIDVLAHRLLVFDSNDRFVRSFPKEPEVAALNRPTHVAVDQAKNVYVTDGMNFRAVVFDWQGNLLTALGEPGDSPGYFSRPKGIAVDSEGHIYVVDSLQSTIQIFNRSGELLLPLGGYGKRPGEFNLPSGIFIDAQDRIFVTDTYNRRVQVLKYLKGSSP